MAIFIIGFYIKINWALAKVFCARGVLCPPPSYVQVIFFLLLVTSVWFRHIACCVAKETKTTVVGGEKTRRSRGKWNRTVCCHHSVSIIFGLLLSVAIIEAVAVTVGLGYRMRKLKSKWSQSSKRLYSHFASPFSTMKIGETDPPWGTVDGN
jgi:hypothetical protein